MTNNFASVYCIQAKRGNKMCPYTIYLCKKFQGNQMTCFELMATLTAWQKEGKTKKNKEAKPIV